MATIPVIDLGGPEHATRDELLAVYAELGFAQVVGHGVAAALVEAVFEAAVRFHALPLAEKLAVELDENHRGYIPIDTSTDTASDYAAVTRPNQSESFVMMRESNPGPADNRFLAGPNQWPALAGFRATLETYNEAMTDLAGRIVALFATALGDRDGAVAALCDPPTTWLRLLHYPPRRPGAPHDLYGSAPHRDFGAITLLAQDSAGGLEVLTPRGRWIAVEPHAGAFVMNIGEVMHRWSNGLLRRTPHRVINRSGRDRYSVPFFYDPDVAAVIAPLPSCVSVDRPAASEPIAFEAFLRAELAAGYDRHAEQEAT